MALCDRPVKNLFQALPEKDDISDNYDENIQKQKQNIQKYYKSFSKSKIKTIISRQYKYNKSDFDKNGIIYAIGIEFDFRKHKTWINPAQKSNDNNKIILTSFPNKMDEGSLSDMIGRLGKQCQLDYEQKEAAWIMIDFVQLEINPTYYTLRHGHLFSWGCLKHWSLEAMNSDNKWICLDKKVNNLDLAGKYKSASWPICTSKSNYYSKYRIKMSGADNSGDYYLCCSGFEIYGNVRINCKGVDVDASQYSITSTVKPSTLCNALNIRDSLTAAIQQTELMKHLEQVQHEYTVKIHDLESKINDKTRENSKYYSQIVELKQQNKHYNEMQRLLLKANEEIQNIRTESELEILYLENISTIENIAMDQYISESEYDLENQLNGAKAKINELHRMIHEYYVKIGDLRCENSELKQKILEANSGELLCESNVSTQLVGESRIYVVYNGSNAFSLLMGRMYS